MPVIRVENLSKSYRLGQIGSSTLRDDLARTWAKLRKQPDPLLRIGQEDQANRQGESIWALKDVSFEVELGEVLGIIGRNGAGKSTLLKILSRVTAPTSGVVKVKGRIASLLEVGTGFHPELTGRENIFLNGAILGMSREEVRRKFDEIVDFSGVEKFIDTPVKRYSSGMYVRLAFAVAAHLEPEILLVDEVLAVGDAEFQKKCVGKMSAVAKGGRTVLFVSHNLAILESLCPNSILIKTGLIDSYGNTKSCIEKYLKFLETIKTYSEKVDIHQSNKKFCLHSIQTQDNNKEPCINFRSDSEIHIRLIYEIFEILLDTRIVIRVIDKFNTVLFSSSDIDNVPNQTHYRSPGTYDALCKIPRNLLNQGEYSISVSADIPMKEWILEEQVLIGFTVDNAGAVGSSFSDNRLGIFRPLLFWTTIIKK
jgi:lipopolysaccharide transport system ATP-binding protein